MNTIADGTFIDRTAMDRLMVLKDDWLAAMATCGELQDFPANEVFIREGEDARHIYILLSGRVKVYGSAENGREFIYNIMGPGDFLGELCLDGGVRSASVATLEPTTCVVVGSDDLRYFMAAHPDFGINLVNKLIQRVRHVTEHLKSVALDDVYHRVVHFLESQAEEQRGRRIVSERLTQQDIADRVGASREMVNRILRNLVQGGFMIKDGRRFVLLKPLPERW